MCLKKLLTFLFLFSVFQNSFSQSAEEMERFAGLNWEDGPKSKSINNNATLKYGEGYVYLKPKQAAEALKLMGNLPSENHWFGPCGDPRAAGIGSPEAIKLVWSGHREIITDTGLVNGNWKQPPTS